MQPTLSPEPIMRIASGFMAAKHLFVASELGIFEALADAPATLDALAARTGLTIRTARISADAMVALELLERSGQEYSNTPVAAAFLTGRSPADLRAFLTFWDQISYPAWTGLGEALATGKPPTQIFDLSDEQQAIVSAGIEAVLAGPSNALPRAVDLSNQRSLLDVGGGTGSWALAVARVYPGLSATVLDLPVVVEIAAGRIAGAGERARVEAVACDVMVEDLPTGHDTFLLANLVHYWDPQENQELLSRLRAVAPAGGLLLLADFWTDATHSQPVHAALMAGEFAVHVDHGDVYSVDEVRAWLTATGWTFVAHEPLAGPQSVIVARAGV
ncbi:methyltransferase [Luteipulveratus mongoliensis]|uniref:SAM-dependent methlyltransferase n=1 Tax=Luteipulveratus mongoliensis TaxID=571913 RepID=A0A0K1JMB1_9MICO|nr:methyltransferase [Luteipulveratus mongoliensis]AKU17715.1 SAM-dependent methlyltransferase [Luteipulveratus mongoliensis]